jgi:mevalonate kinase
MTEHATASAPGKIILFGEHAVVHGQPAIAVPLTAVQATAHAAPGNGLTIHAPDIDQTLHVTLEHDPASNPLHNALGYPAQVTLHALDCPPPDLTLTVHSTIPIASGLGSGAALATVLIRTLAAALGHPLADEQLNALVYEVEKRHHGTPSGIDNTVIVYQQPVYFVRGQPIETFHIQHPFTLVVADTGRSSPTHLAVSDVHKLYETDPARIGAIFAEIGAIARVARQAIEEGTIDALGLLMDENHALLRELTVSSDQLDRLCQAARDAGAWGAKLSGGGRGGNMIALGAPHQAQSIAGALRAAGAAHTIQTHVLPEHFRP